MGTWARTSGGRRTYRKDHRSRHHLLALLLRGKVHNNLLLLLPAPTPDQLTDMLQPFPPTELSLLDLLAARMRLLGLLLRQLLRQLLRLQ